MLNTVETSWVEKIKVNKWKQPESREDWANDLEGGLVLHFESLPFYLKKSEQRFLNSRIQHPKVRNISLDAKGTLKGMVGSLEDQKELTKLILRFRGAAYQLVNSAFPCYKEHLKLAPSSFRPNQVETRSQSICADDKRLHVDAFSTRPNYGERILRVFLNANSNGQPRVWRIGESFVDIARQIAPKIKNYSKVQAKLLHVLGLTKSLRSEYDHLMLGIHDNMKMSDEYQLTSKQMIYAFAPGAVWMCFSDQTSHAVISGQFMFEQTFHLPIASMYRPESSPLLILQRLLKKDLV